MKTRVVFDTNVVLSALLFESGSLTWLRAHWISACVPLASQDTAREITDILRRRKFKLTPDQQFEVTARYLQFCEHVESVQICPVRCRDPKDQPFLDLAFTGAAQVIVTGDRDLLELDGQTAFRILTPAAYTHSIRPAKQGQ